MQLVSAYAPPSSDPTSAVVGDTHGSGGAGAFEDVTPSDIKRHFTLCMTTREARLTALKASFRHVAQLETACAQGMYTACAKTGRPRPDLTMSGLLLKANAALLRTNQLICAAEVKHA
jgi:hypothetical protein